MKKIVTILLLSAAISAPAFAANAGAYIAIDPGIPNNSSATSQFSNTSFKNGLSIAFSGGYRFNQILGVEAGYLASAKSTIETITSATATETFQSSALQIALVGTFPIGSKFDLIGKLGAASTKVEYSASASGGTFVSTVVTSASTSKTNLMYAFGGQFNINPHFGVRVQYQDFGKVNLAVGANNWTSVGAGQDIAVRAISVGMLYTF